MAKGFINSVGWLCSGKYRKREVGEMNEYFIKINEKIFRATCERDALGYVYKFPYNGGNTIRYEALIEMGAVIEMVETPIAITRKEFYEQAAVVSKNMLVVVYNYYGTPPTKTWVDMLWERLSGKI